MSGADLQKPHLFSRLVLVVITILSVIPVVAAITLFAWERRAWSSDPANVEIERTCAKCHSPARPHRYAKSPEEWRKTALRMLAKNPEYGNTIDAQKRGEIVAGLARLRSADGETLFRFRCGRCHEANLINNYPLPDPALTLLVERHVLEHNYAVETWEGALILNYLRSRATGGTQPATQSEPAVQNLYEDRCGRCHTISFRYREMFIPFRSEVEWSAVVERMRMKAPEFIRVEEVETLRRHIISMRDGGRAIP